MDTKGMTFRPGTDAELLEALAFSLRISRNEVLRRGLHALADEHQPHIGELRDKLAELKKEPTKTAYKRPREDQP